MSKHQTKAHFNQTPLRESDPRMVIIYLFAVALIAGCAGALAVLLLPGVLDWLITAIRNLA
jgi:hypothetical protein